MAGLVPAIHVFLICRKGVDARHKAGHDEESKMDSILRTFVERGDLAHVALFLWASGASALAWRAMKELVAANKRFDDFVRELARFNSSFGK